MSVWWGGLPGNETKVFETIVAAAIRIPVSDDWREQEWQGQRMYPDHLTISAPPPARHHTLMHPMTDHASSRIGPDDQGFLTSTGRYVDREEAMRIVRRSGQPHRADLSDDADTLYSEDLW